MGQTLGRMRKRTLSVAMQISQQIIINEQSPVANEAFDLSESANFSIEFVAISDSLKLASKISHCLFKRRSFL